MPSSDFVPYRRPLLRPPHRFRTLQAPPPASTPPPPMPVPSATAPAPAPAPAPSQQPAPMAMPVPVAPSGYSLQHYTTFPGSTQAVFSLCYNMVIREGLEIQHGLLVLETCGRNRAVEHAFLPNLSAAQLPNCRRTGLWDNDRRRYGSFPPLLGRDDWGSHATVSTAEGSGGDGHGRHT